MCDATVLPHWLHLFRCGASHRCEALRVRRRILDVLRFGTPISSGVGKQVSAETQPSGSISKMRGSPLFYYPPFILGAVGAAVALGGLRRQGEQRPAAQLGSG